MVKRVAIILLMCFCVDVSIYAQDYMRIHYKGGTHTDIAITEIDSITFVDVPYFDNRDEQGDGVSLNGSWFWGSQEAGYYELLTFNDDHTYTGYDNYFTYGFDTQTYGWYSHYGTMLTLQSNGFGYKRRFDWYITALTKNAIEVMTKMGSYTYYKLQPDIVRLRVEQSLSCATGESILFVDGIVTSIYDNKLLGLSPGTTYILKAVSDSDIVLAYKIIVES